MARKWKPNRILEIVRKVNIMCMCQDLAQQKRIES